MFRSFFTILYYKQDEERFVSCTIAKENLRPLTLAQRLLVRIQD